MIAHLFDLVKVEITNNKLLGRIRRDITHVLAARIGKIGRAVEVIVSKIFNTDAVDRTDEVHVCNRCSGLFDLPEIA